MKDEPRREYLDINVWNSGNVSYFGQDKNRAWPFQVREIFGKPFTSPFIAINFSLVIKTRLVAASFLLGISLYHLEKIHIDL